ncbi:NHL domain-containing thioredoxin family protein [Pseudactinotalea sp. Z1739]|uniref:NHL domain-containing thioredoxin family protein n=1 Tax=Pseudactinotalea sp. Z1739 TaxID=3413028 RepID=UPI003C7B67AA
MSSTERLPKVRASELTGRGWLNTGGTDLSLHSLRGKIVLLDFWTFCCINCLHVIDELRELEEDFADVLVTIGVHSPKFVHEADPDALAAAIERCDVAHPVLDDPELGTWKAYTARAWPTLVLIDPEGYIVAHMAGEGHAPNLRALIEGLISEHEAAGTLHRGDGPYVPPEPSTELLKFPAKAIRLPSGNLLIADAGHHRLVETEADGETLVRVFGSGERGRTDGDSAVAQFSEPNGLCLLPSHVATQVGYDVVVADTVNHLLRGVHLDSGNVTTIAGTGGQFMLGAPDNVLPDPDDPTPATADYGPARRIKLSSPWDVAWSEAAGAVVIAMAGHHTVWTFEPGDGYLTRLGGTMNEGLVDGPLRQAWFAQPSGLGTDDGGRIWLADAETSAVRRLDVGAGEVHTAIGQGLFEFGHRDGPAGQALLQHPLAVAVLPDGRVAIADTYNGAVRVFDPDTEQVGTLATGLAEPSGLLPTDDGAAVIVVESAAHRLTRVGLGQSVGHADQHQGAAYRTQREVTEVGPQVRLQVRFTAPPGRKLDDRFGPSTQLEVSANSGALVDGAGTGTTLHRDLTLAEGTEGAVLSVTAKAASCDDDPAVLAPACHLAAQDWGIPVRVVPDGPSELVLHLAG